MINYVAASNGGIKMFYGKGRGSKGQYKDFVFSTTPVGVAGFMSELGLSDTLTGSSNMDFATNYTKYNETITKLWRSEYV